MCTNLGGLQQKTTLDEYLGRRGLSAPVSDYMIDKLKVRRNLTQRQRQKLENDAAKAQAEYTQKREAAIKEYREKVKSGEIKEKSRIDTLIDRANGNPDNESTRAARRLLEKKGISWKRRKRK